MATSATIAGTPATTEAIVVRDLVKTYGALRALDGLSLTVRRGEIFALLGPNGAGKTTAVEILEGYRRPDAGTVRVLGYDPIRQGYALKEHIGLMLQQTSLYQDIRVGEAVRLFCSYYQHPADPPSLLALVGLQSHERSSFGRLSGGQKQRLALALALAGQPQVAFLDEPTASMDPQMRLQTWEIIRGLREQGVTTLLTTHYIEEAQRLADHVAIIDHGHLLALGTPEELMAGMATEVVTFSGPAQLDLAPLRRLPGAGGVREERPGAYAISTTAALECVAALAAWRCQAGVELGALRVSGATLEDVFLHLTGQEVRE